VSPHTSLTELKAHGNERDKLLARITQALEKDSRVVAAWLTGSFAAGIADEWSDIDVCSVINDEDFASFVQHRLDVYNRVGEIVATQSIGPSRNSENRGSQFDLLIYRGGMEVDWTLMPLQLAHRPNWTRLLFSRMDIPVDAVVPETYEEQLAQLQGQLDVFWAMAAVGLKEVGRGYTTGAAASVERLTDAFDLLWRRVYRPEEIRPESRTWRHRPAIPELNAMTPRLGKVIDPFQVLEVLHQLRAAVERLHPRLKEMQVSIPVHMPNEMAILSDLALASARLSDTGTNSASEHPG
jgi:predicted nucleotidyltransferase